MQKQHIVSVFTIVLLTGGSAFADRAAPPSLAQKVLGADAVLTGKVQTIEEKTVKAKPIGGDNEVEFRVAVVKVDDGISGVKGLTDVRVAVGPGNRYNPPAKLDKDQEVCLFLRKHPTEPFYVVTNSDYVIDKKNGEYNQAVATIKKLTMLLADADDSLKSKDKDERVLTAALLVMKYRPVFLPPNSKWVDTDAAQSKAILEALADADFNKASPELQGRDDAMSIFLRLGFTEEDGWKLPPNANQKQMAEAAKKWLKENAGTYRIKKLVRESEKDTKEDKSK